MYLGVSYSVGDDLQVVYDGALVRYLQNGVVRREVMAGPNLQFYLDSSFNSPGAAVQDIRFGPYGTAAPVLFNARGNCVVSDTNAQKVGGSSAWDSDFYSIRGYPSCHVSFKPNQTNAAMMIGLNADPLTDSDWPSIDYAWYVTASGTLEVRESGSGDQLSGAGGSYTKATVCAITYDGSTVTYWKDGVSMRTVSVAGLTLYADSSFYDPGAGINSLRFGPTTNLAVADTAQIGQNATYELLESAVVGPTECRTVLPSVSNVNVTSIAVGPYQFDVELVCDVTAEYLHETVSSSWGGYFGITESSSSIPSGEVRAAHWDGTSQSHTWYGSLAGQRRIALSAGATTTVYFQAFGYAVSSAEKFRISNGLLKIEVLKKR
jgi:hypothetical protein